MMVVSIRRLYHENKDLMGRHYFNDITKKNKTKNDRKKEERKEDMVFYDATDQTISNQLILFV